MKIGFIGLGKMGKNMVLHLLENGVEIVAWNRSPEPLAEVVGKGAVGAQSLEDLVNKLDTPRIIWLMLPAGRVVDEFIDQLSHLVQKGDLLIDGGNSFYKDSLRRGEVLDKLAIRFMDVGVSGGPGGARQGACLMIGGKREDFLGVEPLMKRAAAPGAYEYLGDLGAGHFAKMVHNGIEYGMMEAIAEGAAVLKMSSFHFDLKQVFKLYNNRSVIESRLVGWTEEAFAQDENLTDISAIIASTGEGEWTVKTAKEMGVEVPIIEESFKVRMESNQPTDKPWKLFRNRVVSALRGKFGQHKVTV